MQFVFAMVGKNGHHATEMDGNDNQQPRSFPQVMGATFVGSNNVAEGDAVMRLREGTGGWFSNVIVTHPSGTYGVMNNKCGSETRAQSAAEAAKLLSTKPNFLYFSDKNIVGGKSGAFTVDDSCKTGALSKAVTLSPSLRLMPNSPDEGTGMVDPRPEKGGAAYRDVEAAPSGDDFFTTTAFKGAFGDDLWLSGLSYLDAAGRLPGNGPLGVKLCDEIKASTTLKADTAYTLACQVYVRSGATLTIEAGTTIKALADDGTGRAPTLVIDQGAKIVAKGTKDKPITFTSARIPGAKTPRSPARPTPQSGASTTRATSRACTPTPSARDRPTSTRSRCGTPASSSSR